MQNFVIYKNQFLSDDRDQITISNRAETALNNNQFIAHGNTYYEYNDINVNYHSESSTLPEETNETALAKLNDGFEKYGTTPIPLMPPKVIYEHINEVIQEANDFYNDLLNNNLIGIHGGKHNVEVANEMKKFLEETEQSIAAETLNQWHTNKTLTLIQETLERLKNAINDQGLAPEITGLDPIEIKVGEEFNPWHNVTITDDRDTLDQLQLNVELGDFDNTIANTYTITYTVTDIDGNVTIAQRVITVVENDNGGGDNTGGDNTGGGDNIGGGNTGSGDNIGGDNIGGDNIGGDNIGGGDTSNTNVNNSNVDNNNISMNNGPNTGDQSKWYVWLLLSSVSFIGIIIFKRKNKDMNN